MESFKDRITHLRAVQKSELWSKEFGVWQTQGGKGGLEERHGAVLPWDRPKELEGAGLGQERHKNILCSLY